MGFGRQAGWRLGLRALQLSDNKHPSVCAGSPRLPRSLPSPSGLAVGLHLDGMFPFSVRSLGSPSLGGWPQRQLVRRWRSTPCVIDGGAEDAPTSFPYAMCADSLSCRPRATHTPPAPHFVFAGTNGAGVGDRRRLNALPLHSVAPTRVTLGLRRRVRTTRHGARFAV